jgi:hypothetical protein
MVDHSSILQYSPKDGDTRKYSPNRDIAYVFPQLCKAAIAGLDDEDLWKGGLGQYLRSRGVTVEDIAQAATKFAEGIVLFTKYGMKSPRAALEQAGFFDTHEVAQDAIMMRLGQVFTGAFFTAIRDVTPMGGQPPVARDIESLVYSSKELSRDIERRRAGDK